MTPDERREVYRSVFTQNPHGVKILEDLSGIFYDREVYIRGGVDAARQTDFNLGSRHVVRFIYRQIKQLIEDTNDDGSSDPNG